MQSGDASAMYFEYTYERRRTEKEERGCENQQRGREDDAEPKSRSSACSRTADAASTREHTQTEAVGRVSVISIMMTRWTMTKAEDRSKMKDGRRLSGLDDETTLKCTIKARVECSLLMTAKDSDHAHNVYRKSRWWKMKNGHERAKSECRWLRKHSTTRIGNLNYRTNISLKNEIDDMWIYPECDERREKWRSGRWTKCDGPSEFRWRLGANQNDYS